MTISTSIWGAEHPNAGPNIQQLAPKIWLLKFSILTDDKTGLVVVCRDEVEEEEETEAEEEEESWLVWSSSDKRRKRATTDRKDLTCPDSGVFDLSSCKFGAPLFVSW